MPKKQSDPQEDWVMESRFGRWFLSSDTWVRYVLDVAIKEFSRLLERHPRQCFDRVLDAGCGQGRAFETIERIWSPKTIVGVDIDPKLIELARKAADKCACEIILENQNASKLSFPNESFDIIFCHQLLHHSSDQEATLKEFERILAPNGLLLVAESCASFINSVPVKLLFRHPKHAQKTASEFLHLICENGFVVNEADICTSTPRWSRTDFGLLEKIGVNKPNEEPTEILLIAGKPQPKK